MIASPFYNAGGVGYWWLIFPSQSFWLVDNTASGAATLHRVYVR